MKSEIICNANYLLGEVDKRLYSGFIEHLGRAVYSGIFQEDHPAADANGFRQDVLELVRLLDMPLTRYPGGNFVSNYRWEDGIGPREKRPVRMDYAWKSIEPNTFGLDEFMQWCALANTEPIMAVNLGTRGAAEALDLMEYCNHPGGTTLSDLRRSNGSEKPYNIKHWCLGNEMDGVWQAGHKSSREYGALARETAKLLKGLTPDAQMVVCGSSSRLMPTFPVWDREVLEECYEYVDYISLHAYYENNAQDTEKFLTMPEAMDQQIEVITQTCDYVKALKHSEKTVDLCFDEYNIWYRQAGWNVTAPEWIQARPMLEEVYNMEDALVFGGLLMSLQNHCQRVRIACLAQTVNVIAPIMTNPDGGVWKQSIFYPFYYASRYGRGTACKLATRCGNFESGGQAYPLLYSSAIWNQERSELAFFILNRDLKNTNAVELLLEDFNCGAELIEAITLNHADLQTVNRENEENIRPETLPEVAVSGNKVTAVLPKASWNMIRLKLA